MGVTNIVTNIIYLILGSLIRSRTYFNTPEPISFDFITECHEQRKFPRKYWLGLIPFSTQPGTEYKNYVQILTQSGLSGNCWLIIGAKRPARTVRASRVKNYVREEGCDNAIVFELSINSTWSLSKFRSGLTCYCEDATVKPAVGLGANWTFENPGEGYWTIILEWHENPETEWHSQEWVIII